MLTPEDAAALVSALLRDIDHAAEVVECTAAPDGFGYRVQLRIHGDTTKLALFPAGLLTEVAAANAVAARAARLTLQALLLEVETRRAQEFARSSRLRRRLSRPEPPSPP